MDEFRRGKRPHEILMLIAAMLGGMFGLLSYDQVASPSVRALGEVFGYGLYGMLLVMSAITLFGIFFIKFEPGLFTERAGLFALALILFGYGLAVLVIAGTIGTGFLLFTWAFAAANIWRCHQLGDEIDQLQAARKLLSSAVERRERD